jgi:predicted amidohydrolase
VSQPFTVALVQMNSAREVAPNVEAASKLVRAARAQGADLVMLPENTNMIEPRAERRIEKSAPEAADPALKAFRALARETGVWLLVGSLSVRKSRAKVANRSFLVDADGRVVARYDKIHLFDVDLGSEKHKESAIVAPGRRAVVAETPWGNLGMSVCYDLRFPQLYRRLAKAGAVYFAVPSAFTRPTGRAHWHALLRARAIENGAFVFAPAQCGEHAEGRRTFGHSLVVDPWGEVLAEAGDDVEVVTARIDPARVVDARRMIPALTHDRAFV